MFVHSIDTSIDCHLLYNPLGSLAPLSTLHYVQPRSSPSLYPSKLAQSSRAPSSCQATPFPDLADDATHFLALAPLLQGRCTCSCCVFARVLQSLPSHTGQYHVMTQREVSILLGPCRFFLDFEHLKLSG